MPRLGRSSKAKGYRGEVRAVRDLNKRLTTLKAWRTVGSGAFATRADGHGDPYLQGDVQIRSPTRIVEYIEVKVADPNRKAGPIKIAEMDGKDWREHRRILMCRHVPGNKDWLCSMWATTWDDLAERGKSEPTFWVAGQRARGIALGDIQHDMQRAGLACVRWGAFYMTIDKLCQMLEAAYGDSDG